MLKTFRFFIALFGAVCCLIALAHIIIGPTSIPSGGPVTATTDSEERFYAALFLGFGVALVWCSRDVRARSEVLSFFAHHLLLRRRRAYHFSDPVWVPRRVVHFPWSG